MNLDLLEMAQNKLKDLTLATRGCRSAQQSAWGNLVRKSCGWYG